MFFTARQIEDLHRSAGANGHLVLPYRARLTPLAADWVRARKIAVGYSDDGFRSAAGDATAGRANGHGNGTGTGATPLAASRIGNAGPADAAQSAAGEAVAPGAIVYWCDGPCGPAKAALIAQSKESSVRAIDVAADPRQLVAVIRVLADEIGHGRANAGVLAVQNAAAAMVYANRCPSLRAVVGTCMDAVEQGIRLVAANVLVIEHPHRTLQQVKSMLARFAKAPRALPDDVARQLKELANAGCGCSRG